MSSFCTFFYGSALPDPWEVSEEFRALIPETQNAIFEEEEARFLANRYDCEPKGAAWHSQETTGDTLYWFGMSFGGGSNGFFDLQTCPETLKEEVNAAWAQLPLALRNLIGEPQLRGLSASG